MKSEWKTELKEPIKVHILKIVVERDAYIFFLELSLFFAEKTSPGQNDAIWRKYSAIVLLRNALMLSDSTEYSTLQKTKKYTFFGWLPDQEK